MMRYSGGDIGNSERGLGKEGGPKTVLEMQHSLKPFPRGDSVFRTPIEGVSKTLRIMAVLVAISFLLVGFQTVVAENAVEQSPERYTELQTFDNLAEIAPESTVDYDTSSSSTGEFSNMSSNFGPSFAAGTKSEPGTEVATFGQNVKFFDNSENYIYVTDYGVYVFEKDNVNVMKVVESGAGTLIESSSFTVRGEESLESLNPEVLVAENYLFESKVDVLYQGQHQGVLRTYVHFSDFEKPKIDVEFEKVDDCILTEFYIQWVIVPTFRELKIGEYFFDLNALAYPKLITAPEYKLELGNFGGNPESEFKVVVDWSDAAQGAPYVGPIDSPSSSQKRGLQIRFPENLARVDPSIVVETEEPLRESYAYQRRTFYHNQRYWVFYTDESSIYYKSTHDGSYWNDEFVVPTSESIGISEFDMAQRGDTIAISWMKVTDENHVYFLKGTIVENSVDWGTEAEITETEPFYCKVGSYLSTAIDPGNLFWVSFTWWIATDEDCNEPDDTLIVVYVSGDGEVFEMDFLKQEHAVKDVTVKLVPLTNKPLALLWSSKFETHINWVYREWRWHSSGSPWGTDVDMDIGLHIYDQHNSLSAVATNDDIIHIFYRPDGDTRIAYARIERFNCHFFFFGTVYENLAYPTVTVDPTGYIHALWLSGSTGSQRDIYYTRQKPNPPKTDPMDVDLWFDPFIPFDLPNGVYVSLSSPETSTDKLFFIWKEGGSPKRLLFSSFPIANNQASSIVPPWRSRGVSPYQQYLSSRGENVILGTGQLVVMETDIALPGRVIDLSIGRIYDPQRIYADSTSFLPSYYEQSPYSLGSKWYLNFPWIGETYVHLFSGQQYIPVWSENVFENHIGEHFKLTRETDASGDVTGYTLYRKDGFVYQFKGNGHIELIEDIDDENKIMFTYEVYGETERVQKITDTLGRDADFIYVEYRLEEISYRGRVVKYEYDAEDENLLWKITLDPGPGNLQITTLNHYYDYSVYPERPLVNIQYPTGLTSQYGYEKRFVGTDMWTFMVTMQLRHSSEPVNPVDDLTTLEYEQTDGDVRYVSVSNQKEFGDDRYKITTYRLESSKGRMVETVHDWSTLTEMGSLLSRTETFFSAQGGMPVKKNVYLGQSQDVNYSEYYRYDEWGNLIYTRNSMGHERFASYTNTEKQNAFFGAGRMVTGEDYGVFYDSFDERTISSDWMMEGDVELDYQVFSLTPPSIHLDGLGGFASLYRSVDAGANSAVYFEFAIRTRATSDSYCEVKISDSDYFVRVGLILLLGKMYWHNNNVDLHYIMDYSDGRWYRVGIVVDLAERVFNIFVDGEARVIGQPLGSSSLNDVAWIRFTALTGREIWLDEVNVYVDGDFTIVGLELGQRVELYDFSGRLLCSRQAMDVWWSSWWWPTTRNEIVIVIYDLDGTIEYISPERMHWPKHLAYYRPFVYSPLMRTESGFLEKKNAGDAWVDDSLPEPPEDLTLWPDDAHWENAWVTNLAASRQKSHCLGPSIGIHWHGFGGATQAQLSPDNGDYMLQYVWFPSYAFPTRVYLKFHDENDPPDAWHSTGYWTKTQEPLTFDLIPEETGQWHLFIYEWDSMGLGGHVIDGARYQLIDGMACWDFTDIGDQDTGAIIVKGKNGVVDLPQGHLVRLYSADGTLIAEKQVNEFGEARIVLYDQTTKIRTTFPLSGYFQISNPSVPYYKSPIFEKIWGGDEYEYTPNHYFPLSAIPDNMHDRVVGTLEYQNGPSPAFPEQPVPMFTRNFYNGYGQLTASDVSHDDDWLRTSFEYGQYGNLEKVTLPEPGHITEYVYSPAYQGAFLTQAKRTIDGQIISEYYTYYYEPGVVETGELKSVINPRGYATFYHYDSIGRTTQIDHPPIPEGPSTRYEYHDDENYVLKFNENDHPIRLTYDALGRLKYYDRMNPGNPPETVYSRTEYRYDSLGNTVKYITETLDQYEFDYDSLGRRTKTTNPDFSYSIVEYDDLSGFATFVDEVGDKTLHAYDYGGRSISVREYYNNPSDYYETSYEYDEVGNLREVIFNIEGRGSPVLETVDYAYDDLNRLVQIDYPNDSPPTSENWEYDNVGNMVSHTDRKGDTIEFEYDEASQLKKISYPDISWYEEYSYDENGNVESVGRNEDSDYFWLWNGYDERDRLTSQQFSNQGGSVGYGGFLVFDYDDAGNLVELTYPDGYQLTYLYDDFDRPSEVRLESGTSLAKLYYHVDDRVMMVDYLLGELIMQYSYDSLRRVEDIEAVGRQQTFLDMNYQYYDDSNVHKITTPDYEEVYEYDNLGRLDSYTRDNPPKSIQYTYDSIGNWVLKDDFDYGLLGYLYGSYNRVERIVGGGQETILQYDPNGNQEMKEIYILGIWSETWMYEYDYDNNLRKVEKQGIGILGEYFYDALGRRVISESSSSAKAYVYVGGSVVHEWDPITRISCNYVYVNGLLITRINEDNPLDLDIYVQDAAGNTKLVLNMGSQIVFSTNYKPFGIEFGHIGSEVYKYSGEQHDEEIGLYYFGARYYDPSLGKFITEDPCGGSVLNPQTLNLYAYVLNNPLKYSDPDGMWVHILYGALIGAIVGMIAYTAVTLATGAEWNWWHFGASALIGAALGAFTFATFGLGMAAFGVGIPGGIAVGSWPAIGAGVATGAAVGAQAYFLSSILGIATGMMSPRDLSMGGFALSVGLGMASGAIGGRYYDPETYWGTPRPARGGNPGSNPGPVPGEGEVPGPRVSPGRLVEVRRHPLGLEPVGDEISISTARGMGPGHDFYSSQDTAWEAAGPGRILERDISWPVGHVRFWHYHYAGRAHRTHFFFGMGVIRR
jgi:RHS repeat-associated protein